MNAPSGPSSFRGSTNRARAARREPVRPAKRTSSSTSTKEKKRSKPVVKKRSQKKAGGYAPYPQKQKACPPLQYTPTTYVYDKEDPSWRPESPTWPGKDDA